jgi:hypothetical protein
MIHPNTLIGVVMTAARAASADPQSACGSKLTLTITRWHKDKRVRKE